MINMFDELKIKVNNEGKYIRDQMIAYKSMFSCVFCRFYFNLYSDENDSWFTNIFIHVKWMSCQRAK